jgi:hypothetical protein
MDDQDGMRAIGAAVSVLAVDPNPPDAFIRDDCRRLRVGACPIMHVVEDDLITIERVDLVV